MKIDQYKNSNDFIDAGFIYKNLKQYSKQHKYPMGVEKKRMEVSIMYIKDKTKQVIDTISKLKEKTNKIEEDNRNLQSKCNSLVMRLRENLD